ncbi:MAG: DUF924 domain-containing protein [Pseudomonadales bacterium]|nr:DUF924 domain-containing protein [Pseudomonadales bacterium]
MNYQEVISFWFEEVEPKKWWVKDKSFDQEIRKRFMPIHSKAIRCELYDWRKEPLGRLAEIIVLDQFTRNIFRGSPISYAFDALALALSQEAIHTKADEGLSQNQKSFLYMPFMHSESAEIHSKAVELFSAKGLENNLEFENSHKVIIDRFGRYPHRNAVLGRRSTEEEEEFLKQPGSSF